MQSNWTERYERAMHEGAHLPTRVGMQVKDALAYNFGQAFAEILAGTQLSGRSRESEFHQEMVRRNPRYTHHPHRIMVPYEVQHAPLCGVRDLTVASAAAGGYLVGTDTLSMRDILRNRSVCQALGAREITGLQGGVTMPVRTGTTTAHWLTTESTSIGESNQAFGQAAATPKNVAAFTQFSRQLQLQTSPAVAARLVADLSSSLSTARDAAAIQGTGASGQPLGILNTPGIGSVSGASLDYADILEFQAGVLGGKEVDIPSAGWTTTPAIALLLMTRVKFSSTASPIWGGNLYAGEVSGCRAIASGNMPSASMLFAIWSELNFLEWGVLELEIDPYTGFKEGIYGARAILSVDVLIGQRELFSAATSIT